MLARRGDLTYVKSRARRVHIVLTRAEEFRRKAQECRDQAVTAIAHDTKAGWMKLADKWERMADDADPVRQGEPPQLKARR